MIVHRLRTSSRHGEGGGVPEDFMVRHEASDGGRGFIVLGMRVSTLVVKSGRAMKKIARCCQLSRNTRFFSDAIRFT